MNLNYTLHNALQQRVYGSVTSGELFRRAGDSKYFIQCLERSGTLTGHDGCVNSICWNDAGDLLLSGSDDCRLNIYKPFQRKMVQSIRTGHRANIFSAKFLPCSNDIKIVSCSGDGVLHYTDIKRPETFGSHSYNCHSGTAYEVVTTPGDPNTFLSCGEDGTVRLFDVRTKSKCNKRDCKDDILIDSGKAVTSITINPLVPYLLGIGCEDSIVALFDRRSLSTGTSCINNGLNGMISKFKPDDLKDRTCRVTSLEYSSDGSELLVSYCADYVYLYDAKGHKEVRCTSDGAQGNGLLPSTNKKNTPMKRLRLRGDWSDTGPDARPESEASTSTESTLMQRMSDLFVRWIEESFRGSQRNRLRSSQSRTTTSASTSSSTSMSSTTSFPSRSTNSSSSDSSGILEASGVSRDFEGSIDDDADESMSSTPSVITVKEHIVKSDYREFPMESSRESPRESPIESPRESSGESPRESPPECSGATSMEMSGSSGCDDEMGAKHIPGNTSVKRTVDNTQKENSVSPTRKNDNKNDKKQACCDEQCVAHPRGEDFQQEVESACDKKMETEPNCKQMSTENSEQGVASSRGDAVWVPISDRERTNDNSGKSSPQGVASTRGDAVWVPISDHVTTNDSTVEKSQQGVEDTRGNSICEANSASGEQTVESVASTLAEVSPSGDTSSPSNEASSNSTHSAAATRIQRMFRNYKASKTVKTIADWDCYKVDDNDDDGGGIWVPKMTRVYRGHRNARTMIKEARFWGNRYIISGSDCGRIFIWDKHTTEIVMILQGDRHVVNCVQPHPFDPILASSGIDYDIKLWMPTATEPVQIEGLDEIVKTNEQMLAENRDTITVPASFMLRMLASLNHARLGRNQDDSDTDSNESD